MTPQLTPLPIQEANALKVVLNRMDNLPVSGEIAAINVDIAWQLLIDGLPNVRLMALTPQRFATDLTPDPSLTLEVNLFHEG
ncbi:MAG: hypothetical protein NTZ74_05575 [Chloroflexi bacterium]|nr:hypothetical protein [Chloroflexota bacterium]